MLPTGSVELRIFRSWSYLPDPNGRLGGPRQYKLVNHDALQYRYVGTEDDWVNVPIVEGEKPKHPDDIRREEDLKEVTNLINKAVKDGTIKLPNLDLGKID